jgi:hypothetical protein
VSALVIHSAGLSEAVDLRDDRHDDGEDDHHNRRYGAQSDGQDERASV